jgi:biopolymer transport protein ExbB
MKLSNLILSVLCAGASCLAQQPSPDATLARLSSSAEDRLTSSTRELNDLRERVANEKLPLAQNLTASEQRVTALRKEHDRVTRTLDSGNLDIPTIKGEIKAREDELAYIGNFLDEYARTFDTKIHPAEMQVCGKEIDKAKQATEDKDLTTAEKLDRQVGFVDFSIKRLSDVIGGVLFKGVAVDPAGIVSEGTYAVLGPVALFKAQSGTAGVVVSQAGSINPLVRPLEGNIQNGIAPLVDGGEGTLPLDPTRGSALKALIQKTNLLHIFKQGGPIMWPLLVASILALGVVLERVMFLMSVKRRRAPKKLGAVLGALEHGNAAEAVRIGTGCKDHVVRAITYALSHKEQSLSHALLYAQGQELKRFRRGVPVLDTVITLAPLLGLLGTVTGMMGSFSLLGNDIGAPGAITGGIAEALIATAFGLGIAITCLIPFNILNARTDDARHELESAANQVELLIRPQEEQVTWAPQRPITALASTAGI